MFRPKLLTVAIALSCVIAFPLGVRAVIGRERPDLAAWFSFDDGLWAFTRTYEAGSVGPFTIGESREFVKAKLGQLHLLDQDRAQLAYDYERWRVSLPAKGGGYITYTITFAGNRVATLTPYYSVFAGL